MAIEVTKKDGDYYKNNISLKNINRYTGTVNITFDNGVTLHLHKNNKHTVYDPFYFEEMDITLKNVCRLLF